MSDNPVKQTAAMKARVRKLRAQYKRRVTAAAIVCFILGCVAGAFAFRWYVNSNPDRNVDPAAAMVTPAPETAEDEGDPVAEQDAFPEVDKAAEDGEDGDVIFPEDDSEEKADKDEEASSEKAGEEEKAEETEEVKATKKPKKTAKPEATKKPKKTAKPEVTEAPEIFPEDEPEEETEAEAEETKADSEETGAEAEEAKAEAEEAEAGEPEAETEQAEAEESMAEESVEETEAESTPEPEPAKPGEPQVIAIVPYGESFTYTTQINADGSARVEAGDEPFETVSFTQTMRTYMRPTDFAAKYSTQYKLQGDEAGAGFELVLNDYTGEAPIVPQNVVDISLRSESGDAVERGYQLMDAEISGNYGVALTTNVPKMLYKRYQYSSDREEMFYLVVTTYNDGEARMILFQLESDEPEPTPEVVYGILQKGLKSDEVAEMQARLIELGYLQGTADGAFGAMTEEAIKAAQTAFGMEANGIADNAFQQKLYEGMVRATPVPGVYDELKMGSTGDSVIQLQLRLRELGFYDGKADGGFGEMTDAAVKTAQQAYGLPANGVADQAFQEKLFAPTPAPTATPEPNAVG